MAGQRADMLVTDPPYGVEYEPEWRQGVGGWTKSLRQTGKVQNDDRADWSNVFKVSGCAVAYVWHASLRSLDAAAALLTAGYELRNQIIWIKSHFAMSRGDYHWQHEPCWYAVKKDQRSQWAGDRTQSTFWEIAAPSGFGRSGKPEDAPTGHSTQKPADQACAQSPCTANAK